ncbi:hypothetical protein ES332_D10G204900v1 [Gossypium tomentosum]|uniref:Uncharacterized protein n=1 Tax=Gossypium tomentosum TaxID=34277 RepID=A0A5D2J6R3_GOSTO|nr:hypothetical protein ES332_D10G204900v1 [Gossypium tomentosum]
MPVWRLGGRCAGLLNVRATTCVETVAATPKLGRRLLLGFAHSGLIGPNVLGLAQILFGLCKMDCFYYLFFS